MKKPVGRVYRAYQSSPLSRVSLIASGFANFHFNEKSIFPGFAWRYATSRKLPRFDRLRSSPNSNTWCDRDESIVCFNISNNCKMLVLPELLAPNKPVIGAAASPK